MTTALDKARQCEVPVARSASAEPKDNTVQLTFLVDSEQVPIEIRLTGGAAMDLASQVKQCALAAGVWSRQMG